VLTPVANWACTFTVRPPSRTFWVSASSHTKVYGPASSLRERKPSTISSSSAAIRLTCDFDNEVTHSEAAGFSTRRGRDPQQIAGGHHASQRPLGPPPLLQVLRVIRALTQFQDRQLDRPGPGLLKSWSNFLRVSGIAPPKGDVSTLRGET
jgi:hypothetical protein